MRVAHAVLIAAALLGAAPASAETASDMRIWLNGTVMGPISGRVIYFVEAQPRFYDGGSRLGQLILRGAAGWEFSKKLSVYQGYARVIDPGVGGRPDLHEDRVFQQVSWTIAKIGRGTLSSRTRLEERWRSDGDGMGIRLRDMIRYVHPLRSDGKGPKALVYAEPFVNLKGSDWGMRRGHDQLRSFVGLEVPVGDSRSTIEAGYLNQRVNMAGGRIGDNHTLSLTLFVRHR
jgi:hypothetical protein